MDTRITRILRLQRFASARIGRGLLFGALICAGTIEAHAVDMAGPIPPGARSGAAEAPDPIVPGARTGVLQQTSAGSVRIDGVKYPLAAQAMIQTTTGSSLTPKLLEQLNGQRMNVQYLLGTGDTKGEIIRIILPAQR